MRGEVVTFLIAVAVVGCHAGDDDTGPVPADAGEDAGGADDAGPPPCVAPVGPYGVSRGRTFEPFTLQACDGTDHSLYGDAWCDPATRLTVVNFTATWCGPCRSLTGSLPSRIVEPFGPRGVSVVEILVSNDEYAPPDAAFCAEWASAFGLTFPVLIDPEQTTGAYYPGGFPAYLVFDADGTILFQASGAGADVTTLAAALEGLLAE